MTRKKLMWPSDWRLRRQAGRLYVSLFHRENYRLWQKVW